MIAPPCELPCPACKAPLPWTCTDDDGEDAYEDGDAITCVCGNVCRIDVDDDCIATVRS